MALTGSPAATPRAVGSVERRMHQGVAFLTSLLAHVGLLLLLALWAFTQGRNSQGVLLVAPSDASFSVGMMETLDEFAIEPMVANPDDISAASAPSIDLAIDVDIDLHESDDGVEPTDSFSGYYFGAVADGVEESRPPPSGRRGASFFGTYAEGNRFVYVLDCSRSMLGDRWVYACNQLMDSLYGLEPQQEFLVICFDFQPRFLFNRSPSQVRFYHPTSATTTRVRRWLRSIELGPATMPAEALQIALQMEPDAIFLLSDGELQDNTLGMLRILNASSSGRRQIPIHTIHLFSLQGRFTLQRIAYENQGTFTPIEEQRRFHTFSAR
ncbi:MAG: hypothetical protein KatS3mg111_1774 [Pirellulaceae bacterium]|nr:MAG: hypothetical protein KatS3mg111_1774 [Pirellulaceae bacterium]